MSGVPRLSGVPRGPTPQTLLTGSDETVNPATYEHLEAQQTELMRRMKEAGQIEIDETIPDGVVREHVRADQWLNREQRRALAKDARRAKK